MKDDGWWIEGAPGDDGVLSPAAHGAPGDDGALSPAAHGAPGDDVLGGALTHGQHARGRRHHLVLRAPQGSRQGQIRVTLGSH